MMKHFRGPRRKTGSSDTRPLILTCEGAKSQNVEKIHVEEDEPEVWVALRFGDLPMRSTQPERYSRNPEQYDLSMQIQRLKWPLMAKY
jgi:hypothetical protein